MEMFVIAGVVAVVAFVAGRGMVGSRYVTTEHAEATAQSMYMKGLREGRTDYSAQQSATRDSKTISVALAQAFASDEYLKGFHDGMKAVRLHGDSAEAATEAHLMTVMRKKAEALLQFQA